MKNINSAKEFFQKNWNKLEPENKLNILFLLECPGGYLL